MTHCTKRRTAALSLMLFLLCLLCGCQPEAVQLLQLTEPAPSPSQGKEHLIAALNEEYIIRNGNTVSDYYISGADTDAEKALVCIRKHSNNNAKKARDLMECGINGALASELACKNDSIYYLYYAVLPDEAVSGTSLRNGFDFSQSKIPSALYSTRNGFFLPEYVPDDAPMDHEKIGFAVGSIEEQMFVIAISSIPTSST